MKVSAQAPSLVNGEKHFQMSLGGRLVYQNLLLPTALPTHLLCDV